MDEHDRLALAFVEIGDLDAVVPEAGHARAGPLAALGPRSHRHIAIERAGRLARRRSQ